MIKDYERRKKEINVLSGKVIMFELNEKKNADKLLHIHVVHPVTPTSNNCQGIHSKYMVSIVCTTLGSGTRNRPRD